MFINSIHIHLYDISLTQSILYQIKRDVAVWKRLGCPQCNQRTWWQIAATPYTGLAWLYHNRWFQKWNRNERYYTVNIMTTDVRQRKYGRKNFLDALWYQCICTVKSNNVYMIHALLWFSASPFYPYPSGLLHWHWGNHMIAPVPMKQSWRIWVKISHESTENFVIVA